VDPFKPEPTPVEPTQPQEVESNIFREIADLPINVARGAVGSTEALVNLFGADNPISQGLGSANEFLGRLLSAQAKADQQEIARIMEEAQDAGVLENVKAAARAFTVAPLDLVFQGLGSIVPAIAAAKAGTAGLITYGIGSGVGIVKGAIYDAVSGGLQEQGVSKEEAEQAAAQAQEYIGENTDMIAVGGLLGAIASRFGVEPAFMKGKLGEGLADQVAKAAAIEGAEVAAPGVIRRGVTTAVQEGATETVQAGQEQLAANLAQRREDLDVPLMRGVVGQGVLEGLVGAGLGTGLGIREAQVADTMLADQREAARLEAERIAEERTKLELGGIGPERAQWEPIVDAEIATALDTELDTGSIMSKAGALVADYGQEAGDMYLSALREMIRSRGATPPSQEVPTSETVPEDIFDRESVAPEVAASVTELTESIPVAPVAPAATPSIKERAPSIKFTGKQGYASNESVSASLREIEQDDDIALEFEDRVGSVLLQGIGRTAGGKEGRATAVLEEITNWADANNKPLVLMPSGQIEGSKDALKSWYERNGFVVQPDGAMVRQPTAPTTPTETPPSKEVPTLETVPEDIFDRESVAPEEVTPTEATKPTAYRQAIPPRQDDLFGGTEPEVTPLEEPARGPVGRPPIQRTEEQRQRVGELTKEAEAERSRRNYLAKSVENTLTPEAAKPFRMPENPYFSTVDSLLEFEQEQEQVRAAEAAIAPAPEPVAPTNKEEQLAQLVTSPEYSPFFPSIDAFNSFDRKTQDQQNAELLNDVESLGGVAVPGAIQQARGKQKAYIDIKNSLATMPVTAPTAPTPPAPAPEVDVEALREKNKKQIAYNKASTAYQDYLSKQKRARIDAIKEALLFVENSKYKDTTAYKKFESILASDLISPQELASARTEIKGSKERGVPVRKLAETSVGLIDRKRLSGPIVEQTNASVVADMLRKNTDNTKFERLLANILSPLLRRLGVNFKVVDTNGVVPTDIQDIWVDEDGKAASAGIYFPGDNTIYINSTEGLDASTILHEMLHAVSVGVIDSYFENKAGLPPEVREAVETLMEIMSAATDQYLALEAVGRVSEALKAAYISTDGFSDIKEFLSYGNTSQALQTLLLNMPPVKGSAVGAIRTSFSNLVNAIAKLIGFNPGAQFTAFEQLVDVTGRVAEQAAKNPPKMAGEVVRAKADRTKGEDLTKLAVAGRVQRAFYNRTGGLVNFFRTPGRQNQQMENLKFSGAVAARRLIKNASYNYLVEKLTEAGVNAAARVEKLLRVDVAQYRNKNIKSAKRLLDKWESFSRKSPQASEKLENLLNYTSATNILLYDVDNKVYVPVKKAIKQDSKHAELDRDFVALSRNPSPTVQEQAQITRIRNQMLQRANDITQIHQMKDQLRATPEGQKALDLYEQVVTYYHNVHNERLELIKQNILTRTAGNPALGKVLLNEVVAKYEEARKRNSYVPAKRFGPYVVRVYRGANKTGKEGTYTFETRTERNEFIDWHKSTYGTPEEGFALDEFGNDGVDFRADLENSSVELRAMLTRLDSASSLGKEGITELKDDLYQMYLQTLPESDIRRSFMERKDRPGFSNDALRVFKNIALANVNHMARLKYGLDLKNAIEEARASLEGRPIREQELNGILVNDLAERSLTYMSPPTTESQILDKVSRFGTKASFYFLLTSARTALIQPTQLLTTGFATLHAKYGLSKTMAMQVKYLKNFVTMKALGRDNAINENDPILARTLGRPVILTSKYVQNSPIRDALEKAYNYGDMSNVFVATHIHDISGRADDTRELQENTAGKSVNDFVYGVVAGPMHHLERISREVFFMSAFELEYEKQLKKGLTGDAAITAAAEIARLNTNEGMLDYSDLNKPAFAKQWYGRNLYQFQTYRLQMLGFLFQNFYRAFAASGLTSAQKKEAATKFYDVQAMAALMGGATGVFGYSAFMGFIDGLKGFTGEDEDDPLTGTSFDLYVRQSFIPRYFGGDSSLAKQLGLDPETAELLSRGVELGPISALTDWNISGSVSLDGLWFQDRPDKETLEEAYMYTVAETVLGPSASVASNLIRGSNQIIEGDLLRGLETMSPAFIKEPMEAMRFAREGSKQAGTEVVIAPQEYYTGWKLFGQTLGFGSAEVAQEQELRFLLQKEMAEVGEKKSAILSALDKAVLRQSEAYTKHGAESRQVADAKAELDQLFEDLNAYNNQYYYEAITYDTLMDSLKGRAQRRQDTLKGLYVPEWARWIVYPIMMDSPPEPLPAELPRE
jgi:hypothetical protein